MELTILTIHPSIHDKLLPFDSTVVVIFIFGYFFQWTFGRWALFSRYYAVLIKKDITATMTTWHLYMRDCTKQIWIKTMDWRTKILFFSLTILKSNLKHIHLLLKYKPIFWFCNICVGIVFFFCHRKHDTIVPPNILSSIRFKLFERARKFSSN